MLKSHQRAARRTMAVRIRDHERYATQCLMLYERTLSIVQKLIRVEHAGRKFVKHTCPDCGPKPIDEFGVRMLPSGHLGFAPYCLACMSRRKNQARKVQQMDLKATAKEFVARSPKVARQIVARFNEEVADRVEEMRAMRGDKA